MKRKEITILFLAFVLIPCLAVACNTQELKGAKSEMPDTGSTSGWEKPSEALGSEGVSAPSQYNQDVSVKGNYQDLTGLKANNFKTGQATLGVKAPIRMDFGKESTGTLGRGMLDSASGGENPNSNTLDQDWNNREDVY